MYPIYYRIWIEINKSVKSQTEMNEESFEKYFWKFIENLPSLTPKYYSDWITILQVHTCFPNSWISKINWNNSKINFKSYFETHKLNCIKLPNTFKVFCNFKQSKYYWQLMNTQSGVSCVPIGSSWGQVSMAATSCSYN